MKEYKAWEILKMVEEGELDSLDTITDNEGFEAIAENALPQYAPYTIKETPVTFMEAVKSGKRFRVEHGEFKTEEYLWVNDLFRQILLSVTNSYQTREILTEGKFYIER